MTTEAGQGQAAGRGAIPADTFAIRLMLSRVHAGHISIRRAAELCDLDRGSWTNWERGTTPTDKYETAKVIAEKLGVDLIWLLEGGQLGQEVRRPSRRRGREPVTSVYCGTVERPRDNRPSSHPGRGAIRRTSLLPRKHRP